MSQLLPRPDQAPPCSAFTRGLAVRPAGSGLGLDRIIVVDAPQPWPKPALAHEWLTAASPLVARAPVKSRLFAGEPNPDAGGHSVELFERHGLGFRSWRWPVDAANPAHSITEIVTAIVRAPIGKHQTDLTASAEMTEPTFLVCTQGSHDNCCGTLGTALAEQISASRGATAVRRISHTGGHRFAPTFIALPSGRMWAWADLDLVDRIATEAETAEDLAMLCRGWLGASRGPAQVAELAVRASLAAPFEHAPVVAPVAANGDEPVNWTVTAGDQQWVVNVQVGRHVPSIACESPGGQPSKAAAEYVAEIVELANVEQNQSHNREGRRGDS